MKILPIKISDNRHIKEINSSNFRGAISKPATSITNILTLSAKAEERVIKNKALYSKFQLSLPQIEPATIEKIISKFPEYKKEDILTIMNKLTAFSNMESLIGLKQYFKNYSISKFLTFKNEYDYTPKIKKVYTKQGQYKTQAIESAFKRNRPILLNHVFHYLFSTPNAKAPLPSGFYKGIILDENTLDLLEEAKTKNNTLFKKYNEEKFFIIKNLENTYNIFSQDSDFENLVKLNLEKFSQYKKHNPNKSSDQIADMIINGNLIMRAKQLGINPIIIDTVSNNKIDSTTIAKALSAKIPSYEAFEKALNHGVAQVTLLNWKKNNVIDYINKKSYIVTPRVMAQKLKQLKELIENDVRAHGRDVNKIYYNVPVLSKSYSLVNYMYQKINNIDSSRYLYCDTTEYWCCKDLYKELEKNLPQGATLVTIDDAMISGESMFGYPLNYLPNREKGNFDMIFASIYSTDKAKAKFERIKSRIKNDDRIISVDIQNFDKENEYKYSLPNLSKRSFIMFPHIAPDNNPGEFREFFRLFYPDHNFVSETWDEVN